MVYKDYREKLDGEREARSKALSKQRTIKKPYTKKKPTDRR